MNSSTVEKIKIEYEENKYLYEGYCMELQRQMEKMCDDAGIELSFPVEQRVKKWDSIERKFLNHVQNEKLSDFNDIAGIRIITVFQKDIEKVVCLVRENFIIENEEDTSQRLGTNEFGYESIHLEICPPDSWVKIPTLKHFWGLKAEVQIRTAAQHIWAVASHKLQYKQENAIPPQLRRSVHRLAALLELVDIEYSRVVLEKENYNNEISINFESNEINVSSLEIVLNKIFPAENKAVNECYGELLDNLISLNVNTIEQLETILQRHYEKVMREERSMAQGRISQTYFNHIGLARLALSREFKVTFEHGKIKYH